MAEQGDTKQPAGIQPSAEPQQRKARPCPKDCTKCEYKQHAFCAARMSFQMFEVMNGVVQRLDRQSQHIDMLEQRIAALQSSEAEFMSPSPVEGELFTGTK